MKRVVTHPQLSDMGSEIGYYEINKPMTLQQVLDWIKANSKTWGTITVYYKDTGAIIRKFDYDLYSQKQFYHYFNALQYTKEVLTIEYSSCFMYCDYYIYIA